MKFLRNLIFRKFKPSKGKLFDDNIFERLANIYTKNEDLEVEEVVAEDIENEENSENMIQEKQKQLDTIMRQFLGDYLETSNDNYDNNRVNYQELYTRIIENNLEDEVMNLIEENKTRLEDEPSICKFDILNNFTSRLVNGNDFSDVSLDEIISNYLYDVELNEEEEKTVNNSVLFAKKLVESGNSDEELKASIAKNMNIEPNEKVSKLVEMVKNYNKNIRMETIKDFEERINNAKTIEEIEEISSELNSCNQKYLSNGISLTTEYSELKKKIMNKMNDLINSEVEKVTKTADEEEVKKSKEEPKKEEVKKTVKVQKTVVKETIQKSNSEIDYNKMSQGELLENIELLKQKLDSKKAKLADYYDRKIKIDDRENEEKYRDQAYAFKVENFKDDKKVFEKYAKKLNKVKELETLISVLETKANAKRKLEAKKVSEAFDNEYKEKDEILNAKAESNMETIKSLEEKIESKKNKASKYYEENIKDKENVKREQLEKYGKKLNKIKELEEELKIMNIKYNAIHNKKQEIYNSLFEAENVKTLKM